MAHVLKHWQVEKKQGTIKEICDKLEQDEAELSTFDHTYIELQNMFEEKQGTFHRRLETSLCCTPADASLISGSKVS